MQQSHGGATDPQMRTELVSAISAASSLQTTTAAPPLTPGGLCSDDPNITFNLRMCIIVGSSVGGGLLFLILGVVVYRRRKKKTISLDKFIDGTQQGTTTATTTQARLNLAASASTSPRGGSSPINRFIDPNERRTKDYSPPRQEASSSLYHNSNANGNGNDNDDAHTGFANRTFIPQVDEVDMYFADDMMLGDDEEEMLDINANDVHDRYNNNNNDDDDDVVDMNAFDQMYHDEANGHLDAFGSRGNQSGQSSTKTAKKSSSNKGKEVSRDEIIDIL